MPKFSWVGPIEKGNAIVLASRRWPKRFRVAPRAGADALRSPTCRGRVAAAVFLGLFVLVSASIAGARAQQVLAPIHPPKIQKSRADFGQIRRNVVGIVTGSPKGVYASLGSDLLRLLDDRQNQQLRLAVLVGSGSIDNLDDLSNLPGVSFAIVQGDVLAAYAADRFQADWLRHNLRYVGGLHMEVLHVVTRKEIVERGGGTICALRNMRLNVGGLGSGARITVERVFNDLLGLHITMDTGSLNQAFDQLAKKQVDAFAYVVGHSAPLFQTEDLDKRFADDKFDWLEAPADLLDTGCAGTSVRHAADATIYRSAELTEADHYPGIAPGRIVRTIGMPAVLANYSFGDPRKRQAIVAATFIRRLFEKATDPEHGLGHKEDGFDANWCGIDLAATLPTSTWTRDPTAEAWIEANKQTSHPRSTQIFCEPIAKPPYCDSSTHEVAEFNRQRIADHRNVDTADPDYMIDFADWKRRVCG